MGPLLGVSAYYGGLAHLLYCGNDRIIRGSSSSSIDLIPRVALRIAKLALVRKKFSNVRLNEILENWEACMGCGLPR